MGEQWQSRRVPRLVQHGNDTVLLGSALLLAFSAGINPLTHHWLMVKIIGLILYIALGTVVMRRQCSLGSRILAFACALLLFGFLVSVALSKSPYGGLGYSASTAMQMLVSI